MRKVLRKWNNLFSVQILLFIIAILFCINSYRRSQESIMALLLPAELEGEYRLGREEWKPYHAGDKISALKGDLVFRGNFNLDFSMADQFQFYLDHVELTVFQNGEKVFSSKEEYPLTAETTCIKGWRTWYCEPIQQEDVLEFHLHNPHRAGNVNAYNSFLESIFACPEMLLQGKLQMDHQSLQILSLLLLTISLIMLGMAAGSTVIDSELGLKLWPLGLLILFMGGYILFDRQMDIINYYRDILATNLQRLCMMFAAYETSVIVQTEVNERRELKMPNILRWLSLFNIGLLLTALFGNLILYDTLLIWQLVQGLVFMILIFFGCKTFIEQTSKKWDMLFSGIFLMLAFLLEFFNGYWYLWEQGFVCKTVFVLCLLHHLIEGVRTVPKNYRASKETERLKRELKNSRVVLATSQIRTHFIFNVLNAISGMCLYDPAEANKTVVHFAKYLRGNINILQDDELIHFNRELEHLENYIALEKVRFEDRIHFVKELETEEFLIPPLVLQPLVENAIKHGLLRTSQGGTVRLKTRRESDQIVIQIVDNGAGFDTQKPLREGAVGLSNVKFRLEYMIKGTMEIESLPGEGTTITIRMPYVIM